MFAVSSVAVLQLWPAGCGLQHYHDWGWVLPPPMWSWAPCTCSLPVSTLWIRS